MTFGATSHGTFKPLAGFSPPPSITCNKAALDGSLMPLLPSAPHFPQRHRRLARNRGTAIYSEAPKPDKPNRVSFVLPFHDETLAFSAGLSRAVIFRPPSCLSPAGLPPLHARFCGSREVVSSLTNLSKRQKRSPWNGRTGSGQAIGTNQP